MMKKYLMICAMLFCMGAVLTGCGSKEKAKTEDETETTDTAESEEIEIPSMEDIDLDKVLTLGKYKGITIDKEAVTVADEDIESELKYRLSSNPEEIAEGVVETGDTVNMKFVGKVDGKEFEGGSSDSYDLVIGSGQFIEGFEEGLVGTTKGQTLDLNLKFPEGYSEELGGKAVVFTVTINAIKRPVAEATDEWVAANTDYKTVDEYKESIREELQKSNEDAATTSLQTTAWQQVVQSSKINEYPEKLLKYGAEIFKSQIQMYADAASMSLEDYIKEQGMTQEQFDEQAEEYGKNVATQMLVMQAIIDKEGMKTEDKEYKEILQGYLDQEGKTEEEFFEQYPKANVEQSIMMERICNIIVENAKINEVTPTPEPVVESPVDGAEQPAETPTEATEETPAE